ncbi:MAG: hypothetical protein QMD22_08475, partial [archaeon]|nr:hypothetical protein [archaeon]
MTITSIPISSFEGFGIKIEAKEANRAEIHEAIDSWIDEVVEMKKGAGLGGITEEIFKKRQEMMGKIVEQIVEELFSEELNRETMTCPNCGRVLNRREMHERTVETIIGEIRLKRPYFYCEKCKEGFHPLDDVLILS